MTKNHAVLAGPLLTAMLAIIFCVWSALGNDVNFCVTTGCALYQDFTVAGISLWWIGTAAFTLLAVCALLGQSFAGRALAAIFLIGDTLLLLLMAFTAPCISCLGVAVLFALSYISFRYSYYSTPQKSKPALPVAHRALLFCWTVLFIINIGLVARSQLDIWPILNEGGEARESMFFSPSCPHCVEGINALSGNVNMAFYPVAENDADVWRLAKMISLLDEGLSLREALGQSADAEKEGFFSSFSPEILLLRFRLLRNKAHVFMAGSQGVPFFEYRGLPPDVRRKARDSANRSAASAKNVENSESAAPQSSIEPRDAALPPELDDGQCVAGKPCPPAN